jgi:hypothetical protein
MISTAVQTLRLSVTLARTVVSARNGPELAVGGSPLVEIQPPLVAVFNVRAARDVSERAAHVGE